VFLATAVAGGTLLLSANLLTPVSLQSILQAVDVAPVFQLSFLSNYGKPLVFS
jgi:hypothetical protein